MQEEIKNYLKSHPEFFEENASFLADIHLPSPHGSGTISLAERQQLAQRDKISALEERFAELVVNAQENDKIADKIHTFSVLLQQARNFDAVEQLVSHYLPEEFNITDTYLRIWATPSNPADQQNLVFSPVPEAHKDWVLEIHNVYCGGIPSIDIDDWFLEPAASIAVFPLRVHDQVFGFLALSSDNTERFYVGMGTDFLQKLGDHIGGALTRHLIFTNE